MFVHLSNSWQNSKHKWSWKCWPIQCTTLLVWSNASDCNDACRYLLGNTSRRLIQGQIVSYLSEHHPALCCVSFAYSMCQKYSIMATFAGCPDPLHETSLQALGHWLLSPLSTGKRLYLSLNRQKSVKGIRFKLCTFSLCFPSRPCSQIHLDRQLNSCEIQGAFGIATQGFRCLEWLFWILFLVWASFCSAFCQDSSPRNLPCLNIAYKGSLCLGSPCVCCMLVATCLYFLHVSTCGGQGWVHIGICIYAACTHLYVWCHCACAQVFVRMCLS